ncbi:glycosyltransferase [Conexibacter stalactiti]|uniref:Glycosyltransferase n=1 Tax=Conexibacter stalactiti TaxID=1940611 RepID=A0ABU4I061_9ACTN|nr:glycosyltransferase [Conexibacter stalactiti]MDW5598828.1 glycosyltransferase [Conexibacter stalactiti]MEC5039470.1 glycosyltransferase [Conexibacter stalactiti]
MRVLLTFAGGRGHAGPLLPLARALRAAGHAVAFNGRATVVAELSDLGEPLPDADDAGSEPIAIAPLLAPDAAREDAVLRDGFAGAVARRRAGSVHALCERWTPDLIVRDELDFGALVAAEARGLPHATVLVSASGAFVRPPLVAPPLDALRADYGLAPDPSLTAPARHLVLSPSPPRFRDPAFPLPATALAFRSGPGGEPGGAARRGRGSDDEPAPPWPVAIPGAPTVYATLGTIFNAESGDLFARLLEGLRALPLNVVVTVGRALDPAGFGPQPPHVRIERHLPQARVLTRCDLVVSHGGSGTVVDALAAGLPSLLLPLGADQLLNAARCEALGVGVALDVVNATPQAIGAAATRLLDDRATAAAARAFALEIGALPGPDACVPALEEIASAGAAAGGTVAP